jgi:hypothetical protein
MGVVTAETGAPRRDEMSRPRVALVTARLGADLGSDEETPLLDARLRGKADTRVVVWDDPTVDWAGFDVAVIRSTWDYPTRLAEFLTWIDRCAARTRLVNPAPLLRWNTDKTYLRDLADRGVPTVPTRYLPPGTPLNVAPDVEFVVKPTVGGGAWETARYSPEQLPTAREHVARLHRAGVTAMLQPYRSAVDTTGERALVLIDGEYRHAIRKAAVLAPGEDARTVREPHPDARPWSATPAEREVARQALAAVPAHAGGGAPPSYARVDLVDGPDGRPQVMELELVEPNLFLDLHPETVDVFARAVLRAAG